MEITRAGPDRAKIKRGHGFEIVVEHVGLRRDHLFKRAAALFQEIGRQHLDGRLRRGSADGLDCGREMPCSAVFQVVPVHGRDHHMLKAKRRNRAGDVSGSPASSAPGSPVFTLQNAQARVQVSPMIIMVACFFSQHSPMFGQPASSQTVCKWFVRMISAVFA